MKLKNRNIQDTILFRNCLLDFDIATR